MIVSADLARKYSCTGDFRADMTDDEASAAAFPPTCAQQYWFYSFELDGLARRRRVVPPAVQRGVRAAVGRTPAVGHPASGLLLHLAGPYRRGRRRAASDPAGGDGTDRVRGRRADDDARHLRNRRHQDSPPGRARVACAPPARCRPRPALRRHVPAARRRCAARRRRRIGGWCPALAARTGRIGAGPGGDARPESADARDPACGGRPRRRALRCLGAGRGRRAAASHSPGAPLGAAGRALREPAAAQQPSGDDHGRERGARPGPAGHRRRDPGLRGRGRVRRRGASRSAPPSRRWSTTRSSTAGRGTSP